MSKGHKDNHRARKKRGNIAFAKKAERRKERKFTGSWRVDFSCGRTEFVPLAGSDDVTQVAARQHDCMEECVVLKRHPQR